MIFGVFDIVCYDLAGYGVFKVGMRARRQGRAWTHESSGAFDMGSKRADESPSLSRFREIGESSGADNAQAHGATGFFDCRSALVHDEPTER
jgi:hypothetical protein